MALPTGELSGVQESERILSDLENRVGVLRGDGYHVGLHLYNPYPDHQPSKTYTTMKRKKAGEIGIAASVNEVPAEYVDTWVALSNSVGVDGIVVQLPFPPEKGHLAKVALDTVDPSRDVDGLRSNGSLFEPATARAALRLFEANGGDPSTEKFAIVGNKGRLLGAPLMKMLEGKSVAVRGFDRDVTEEERLDVLNWASVIVTATSTANPFEHADFYNASQPRVIIDAGEPDRTSGRRGDLTDDVRIAFLDRGWGMSTPIGSIGPLTVATLLEHTVQSAEARA